MNKSIIKLKDIVKVFRVKTEDIIVLKKVSLEITEKTFTIIFGPSGCGKSTLLHIVLGLEKPTSGNFTFFEQDLYSHPEDYRSEFRKSNIGMIYQQPNWIKSLNVAENIAFAGLLVGMDKKVALKKAHEVLNLVGMEKWAGYIPTELSSGQQQKVSLARALVTDPKVIIADEPTGNLDYQSGVDLMNLFDKLIADGKTIIMVTHDVNIIEHANRVVQMFDGNIVNIFDMQTSDLKSTKQSLYRSCLQSNLPERLEFFQACISANIKTKYIATSAVNLADAKKCALWLFADCKLYVHSVSLYRESIA